MKQILTKSVLRAKDLTGTERKSFLLSNRDAMIAEKKSLPIKFTEPVSFEANVWELEQGLAIKTAIGKIQPNATSVLVKVVANACWFMDSQFDVLIDDSAKKTISDRKPLIKHIRDHEYEVNAEVGDVQDIYLEDILLTDLGYKAKGKTQCIIFETDIRKDYDEKIFEKYAAGKINQHSIGLQYVKIDLAIYDEEDEKELDFWNKYFPKIINKDVAEEYGFFFVVGEIKLLENSCVLFGSNELTPTLEVSSTKSLPSHDTDAAPHLDFNQLTKAISETQFFNI